MTDFFAQQDFARRRTKWLVLYFILAVVSIIAVIYLALAFVFQLNSAQVTLGEGDWLWHPQMLLGVGGGTLAIVGIGCWLKISELAAGGSAVATLLGGRPLNLTPADPDERKFHNVVEEISIASGVPVPELFVLENERSINAFAAGWAPGDAAIGVTRGALRLLSRDELQGVIAHEFSHILNGDMRLNIRLMGVVHGLLCLALVGRELLHFAGRMSRGSRRSKGGNPAALLGLIGLILLVIGSLGVFFGRLIKSAVSRQREYLADAAAVQFTRNPSGLAGALKKIGGLSLGSRLLTPNAEEASHLFFGNGLASSWFNWMSTHPPLRERIKRLDRNFDGTFPRVEAPAVATTDYDAERDVVEILGGNRNRPGSAWGRDLARGLAGEPAAPVPPILSEPPSRPVRVIDLDAELSPGAGHLERAVELVAMLPPALEDAARDPLAAGALVYGLLLSPGEAQRAAQLAALAAHVRPAVLQELNRLWPLIQSLPRAQRLPLVELAVPALRRLSPEQYEFFAQDVRLIIESDAQVDLFELALQKLLERHLAPQFHRLPPQRIDYYVLRPLADDCAVLLSAVALVGNDPAPAATAFQAGLRTLDVEPGRVRFLPVAECGVARISTALDNLGRGSLAVRKRVLFACAAAAAHDGVLHEDEAELLRAIADALGCPLPPVLGKLRLQFSG
jgi:Zn-dependent protease with chaperone function